MMLLLCLLVAIGSLIGILCPFWLEKPKVLEPSQIVSDPDVLAKRKKHILDLFVSAEKLFEDGQLSRNEWNRRRNFLESSFIDLSRRLDFVTSKNEKTL